MQLAAPENLACPLCSAPLEYGQGRLLCASNHSFDMARQGYANLLPVQHKKSREPGDSKAMVQARQQFLDAGFYAPIALKLADLAGPGPDADGKRFSILDAGCGEGYYLDYLIRHLQETSGPGGMLSAIGLDISRDAIVAAARRNRQVQWLVGTNVHPPVLPGSVDLLMCLFGFPSFRHFRSVLRESGKCILVDPGPEHLIELRALIYPEVRRSPPPALTGIGDFGLDVSHSEALQYRIEAMDQAQIRNLLTMTPHLYKASAAGRQAAMAVDRLDLTVDVVFRVLEVLPC